MTAVVELRTERVVLRDWREEDLPLFAALNADPRVIGEFSWRAPTTPNSFAPR